MNRLVDDEIKKKLVKSFIIPFLASIVFGLLTMGLTKFSLKVITASLAAGVEFMFTVSIFTLFMEPARGATLIILYAVAGFLAGMIWSQIACPPWSVFITGSVGGVLSVLWIYTGGAYRGKE